MTLVAEDHAVVGVEVDEAGAGAGNHRGGKLGIGAEKPCQKAHRQIEHAKVNNGGAQRAEHELEHDLEYTPAVLHRVIVGAVILRVIDSLDGLLVEGDTHTLHVQKHIGLILKALALDGAEALQILPGNCAKPGLGIVYLNAVADAEKPCGGLVACNGAGRHTGLIKVTAAQNHLIFKLKHPVAAGNDVVRQMLPVTVNGDNALCLRDVGKHKLKGGLQRSALALVHPVVQHMALTVLSGSFKKALLLVGAAVVHYNDMLKALFYKTVNHGAELIVRVQGGQDYGKSCSAILYNFTHTILRNSPGGHYNQ